MRIVAIIEARMGSSRLPGKTLRNIIGKPMLELMVERVKHSRLIDDVVVATTIDKEDLRIVELAKKLGIKSFQGSVDNVLERVLSAAKANKVDVIVELTGDCPLLDPWITDRVVKEYIDSKSDYASNNLKRTYPIGTETKVFSTAVLDEVNNLTKDPFDQEHVSLYIYEHPERYKLLNAEAPPELNRPDVRLTVDTQEDFFVIEAIYKALYGNGRIFNLKEILEFLDRNPEIKKINEQIKQKPVRYDKSK